MLKQYGRQLAVIQRLIDALIISSFFYVAYCLSSGINIYTPELAPPQYLLFLGGYLVVWFAVSKRFQTYKSLRTRRFFHVAAGVVKASLLSLVVSFLLPYIIYEVQVGRTFIVLFWSMNTACLLLLRHVVKRTLSAIRKAGRNYRQILMVGRNKRAVALLGDIEEMPELGYNVLGFVDAENKNTCCPSLDKYPFLGGLADFERLLRDNVVDEVYIFLPIKSFYQEIERILGVCEEVGVQVKLSTEIFVHKMSKYTISMLGESTLIDLYTGPKMDWHITIKRIIDVVISAVSLVVLSPFLILIGISIKATSKGPVIFRQKRKGYNGRIFECLKFRTMVDGADAMKKDLLALNEEDGPAFKIKSDPRVTDVGRFLRKTSLDELPQLYNVLVGDMSLVGPRPPLPDEVIQYNLPYLRRLSMRPGITCIWQVMGRNKVSFKKWMDLDRHYIDHWSLWLDFKILAKTITVVLKGSGS